MYISFVEAMINYYSLLGIPNFSAWSVVRKAYIVQIKKYHPDVNKSADAARMSSALNAAKEMLEIPGQKAAYDRKLKRRLENPTRAPRSAMRKQTQRAYEQKRAAKMAAEARRRENAKKQREVFLNAKKLKEYEESLRLYPLWLRYALCSLLGVFFLFLPLTSADKSIWLILLLFVLPFYYMAILLAVNQYFKKLYFENYKKGVNVDLNRATKRFINFFFYSGIALVVLIIILS